MYIVVVSARGSGLRAHGRHSARRPSDLGGNLLISELVVVFNYIGYTLYKYIYIYIHIHVSDTYLLY